MEPSFRNAWDPKTSAAEAPKQTHASTATDRHSISRNKAEPLQAGLAPKLSNAQYAEEQPPPHAASDNAPRPLQQTDDGHENTVVARDIDQASGDVLGVKSSFQGPNLDSTTRRENPTSCGKWILSEESLLRLEAGIRAQKEQELIATAEIGPRDGDGPRQEPDEIALSAPPARIGLCAHDTTHGLSRAIPLPVQGSSLRDNEGCVQTLGTFNSEPVPQAAPERPERLQASEPPLLVENDVDEYLRWLGASGKREGSPKRLPPAIQLPPVTGLPPVREARAAEAFINDFRAAPSLVTEHRRVPVPMQRRHGNLITPLLMIGSTVAVLIAYFSVGNLVSGLDSERTPKLASVDSRIIAAPLMAAAEQKLRPNEERESAAATPPGDEISPQSAIIPPVGSTETGALSQNTAPPQSSTSRIAKSSPDPGEVQTPPASKAVRRLDSEEIKLLMKQGEQFTAAGDLATARLVFQRAAEAGDATAALAIGATYDPIVLNKVGVLGTSADVGKARTWYQKAKELGSPEASRHLELLANH